MLSQERQAFPMTFPKLAGRSAGEKTWKSENDRDGNGRAKSGLQEKFFCLLNMIGCGFYVYLT